MLAMILFAEKCTFGFSRSCETGRSGLFHSKQFSTIFVACLLGLGSCTFSLCGGVHRVFPSLFYLGR